jgi:hypothetical protein
LSIIPYKKKKEDHHLLPKTTTWALATKGIFSSRSTQKHTFIMSNYYSNTTYPIFFKPSAFIFNVVDAGVHFLVLVASIRKKESSRGPF